MAINDFVICYDIAHPKRLQKVHKLVSKHLTQLQYSEYYGRLTTQTMDGIINGLQSIIDSDEDDVRVYLTEPMCSAITSSKLPEDIMLFSPDI